MGPTAHAQGAEEQPRRVPSAPQRATAAPCGAGEARDEIVTRSPPGAHFLHSAVYRERVRVQPHVRRRAAALAQVAEHGGGVVVDAVEHEHPQQRRRLGGGGGGGGGVSGVGVSGGDGDGVGAFTLGRGRSRTSEADRWLPKLL